MTVVEGENWIRCLSLFLRLNKTLRDFILEQAVRYIEDTMIKSIRITWKEELNHSEKFARLSTLLSFEKAESNLPSGAVYYVDCMCADILDEDNPSPDHILSFVFFDCVLCEHDDVFEKPFNTMSTQQRLLAYFTPGLLCYVQDKREESSRARAERKRQSTCSGQEKPSWKARWDQKRAIQ